jgi:hypothetical protein
VIGTGRFARADRGVTPIAGVHERERVRALRR